VSLRTDSDEEPNRLTSKESDDSVDDGPVSNHCVYVWRTRGSSVAQNEVYVKASPLHEVLIPSSHDLSITVSRPGAVVTYGLAMWSHFAIPGESPPGVLFRTLVIPQLSDGH
jgi:hypothetical protein